MRNKNDVQDIDVVRAWKDAEYRNGLSQIQIENLPENPAGGTHLSSEELGDISGGSHSVLCRVSHGIGCGGKFTKGIGCGIFTLGFKTNGGNSIRSGSSIRKFRSR